MPNFRSGNLVTGEPLGNLLKTVSLTADNQLVNVWGYGVIELISDNTTANNRTFTLINGNIVGQTLTLYLVSGSSTTCQLAASGNTKLSAAWEPLQYDNLSLMWNGTYWIETARVDAA